MYVIRIYCGDELVVKQQIIGYTQEEASEIFHQRISETDGAMSATLDGHALGDWMGTTCERWEADD